MPVNNSPLPWTNHAGWQEICDSLQQAIANGKLCIIVPTMNAAPFIDITLSYYANINIPVTVMVDTKSCDSTELCAKQYAKDVKRVDNSSSVVEGMIEQLSRQAGTDWVLRLDDDELPSLAMLAQVAKLITLKDIHAAGFVRKQCAVSTEKTLLASMLHRETDHRQWRLYRPDRMRYTQNVHTAGFEPVAKHSFAVPAEAFMVHLDWSLHDYQSRGAKVARYDAHTEGKGSMWRDFYLYEDDPNHGASQFARVDAPEFDGVCKQIADRFPGNCVSTAQARSSVKRGWRRFLLG
jgi:glycosyltransferase involved in cell wall biosynthesis